MNSNTGEIIEFPKSKGPLPKPFIELTAEEKQFVELFPANPDHRIYPKAYPYRNRALEIFRLSNQEVQVAMVNVFSNLPKDQRLSTLERLWDIRVQKFQCAPKNTDEPWAGGAATAKIRRAKVRKAHSRKLKKHHRKFRR